MIKFSAEYVAGIFMGAGAAIFFLALATQSDLLSTEFSTSKGALIGGLMLLLTGSGMKWRTQAAKKTDQ